MEYYFFIDKYNHIIEVLTDSDVRRGLIKRVYIENKIEYVIQPHPCFIRKWECNINNIIQYREEHLRIIPILDTEDKIVNLVFP